MAISNGNEEEKSPIAALKEVLAASQQMHEILLVDTHSHAHLDRESDDSYRWERTETAQEDVPIISLCCAVEEKDWKAALDYSSKSNLCLPALGIHPWYLADLSPTWLRDLESLLLDHPNAIVGEIGLCKMARFLRTYKGGKTEALQIQRDVFKRQMLLASKLRRPVSVHCVKQHGVFMAILDELLGEGPLPPAIGMHSFTGTAHHAKQLLDWEKKHHDQQSGAGVLFYFGFSHAVNVAMCTSAKSIRQTTDAIRSIPLDRILAESDVHSHSDVAAGTAGAVAHIANALDKSTQDVATLTRDNGLNFLKTALHTKERSTPQGITIK